MLNAAMTAARTLEVIEAAIDFMKSHDHEISKREYIRSNQEVLITALNHERDCLLDYFDRRVSERREALEEFYGLLHSAVESGDVTHLNASLAGILGIIKDNPLGDLVEFRKLRDDPNYRISL